MEIPHYSGDLPYLTTEQMVEVDRAMIEDYQIELIQMMENAGRALALLARQRFLGGNARGAKIGVLAGTGSNGGGALVAARRLHIWGVQVQVVLTKPDAALAPVPAHQLAILRHMQVPILQASEIQQAQPPDLVIDGIIGYSLKGNPRGAAGDLIRWTNQQGVSVLALDAPSGVDASSGTVYDPAIAATATLTLALPKAGLRAPGIESSVGELYMADISVPPELYAAPALRLHVGPIFAESDVVRLR